MNRRHSPAVYRRRRLVVFGGLLLILAAIGVGVWLLIAQPWAAGGTPNPQNTAGVVEPGEVTDPESGGSTEPPECTAADVTVQPVTDATEYRSGVNPQLSILLTNTSGHDCTINVGSATQVFTITSGNDVWWRSTDCQEEFSDMVVTLEAGQEVGSSTPLEWNRTRSAADRCGDTSRQSAPGGGASYHLSVEIGGVASQGTRQIFLY